LKKMMNDQSIIDNTHFKEVEGKLICYTNLPGEDKFAQEVSSKEAVQKNMIGWCNTVREYMNVKEREAEREREAAKARRQAEQAELAAFPPEDAAVSPEPQPSTPSVTSVAGGGDPREAVLTWYEDTQAKIDDLSQIIHDAREERKHLRDERDRIKPIIDAWKGVKGES
jgi:hypothetical protein